MKDDIFNPNSYTEKAMPLTTALYNALKCSEISDFDLVSDDIKAHRKSVKADFSEIEYSLFDKVFTAYSEEMSMESNESFNRGFKLGAMLMKELLG